jgi:putative chitinase
MLTENMLRALWPLGDTKVPGLIEVIAATAPTIFPKYGLTDDLLIAHAMAQFSHECGAGTEMTENIHYTPARACQVWPNRFSSVADCLRKVGSFPGDPNFPTKLIEKVYGGRNGNTQPHDGSIFIGRGLSQVTGRGNYQALDDKIGTHLGPVDHPKRVNEPANALECGVADFVLCGCLPFAANDDLDGVTVHLNGGHTGQSERAAWLTKWKIALGAANPVPHSTTWLQMSLNTLGADPPLVPDGKFGPLTAAALKAFQKQHGIDPADGRTSPETFAAIDAALPAA